MRALTALAILLPLSACGSSSDTDDPAAKEAADAAAIAAVEEAMTPPAIPIEPQPILFPDIERFDLFGAGCSFVPAGGGMGAIALTMNERGFMKLDDAIERFAADIGSDPAPLQTRVGYTSRRYAMRLEIDESSADKTGYETVDYDAALSVSDGRGIVYQSAGTAQCGS